jgi:hypothetical protein
MLPRQIGPRSHQHRELVVADRALEQHAEAGMGDARRGVPRHRVGDLLLTARHQHVGHRLAEVLALRYRQQMLLALAVGVVDQVRLFEAFGRAQQRTRHFDVIVKGEQADDAGWGVRRRRQALGKLGASHRLDGRGEPRDHLFEQVDLID